MENVILFSDLQGERAETIWPELEKYYADRSGRAWGPARHTRVAGSYAWRMPSFPDQRWAFSWMADGAFWSDLESLSDLDLVREIAPDELALRQLAADDETARHVLDDWLIDRGLPAIDYQALLDLRFRYERGDRLSLSGVALPPAAVVDRRDSLAYAVFSREHTVYLRSGESWEHERTFASREVAQEWAHSQDLGYQIRDNTGIIVEAATARVRQ